MPDFSDHTPEQLAEVFEAAASRLGQLGRDGREAVQLRLSNQRDPDVIEGIAQLQDALDGID